MATTWRPFGLEERTCPVCDKLFRTTQGRNAHLTNARSCSWYRQGKLRDLTLEPDPPIVMDEDEHHVFDKDGEGDGKRDSEEIEIPDEDHEDFFHFIPPAEHRSDQDQTAEFVQGSSRGPRMLDDDDDTIVTEEWVDAGQVIRMDHNLHHQWRQAFQHDAEGDIQMGTPSEPLNSFHPFASELDWRVASWFVQDQPGHKVFDRFLAIPGVSSQVFIYTHPPHLANKCLFFLRSENHWDSPSIICVHYIKRWTLSLIAEDDGTRRSSYLMIALSKSILFAIRTSSLPLDLSGGIPR